MTLKRVTFFVILGLCCTFALRTLGTFSPHAFVSPLAARMVKVVFLFSTLVLISFFLLFRRDYARGGRAALNAPSVLVIIGLCVIVVFHIKDLLLTFDSLVINMYEMSPSFFRFVRSHCPEALISWLSSIFLLYFFAVLRGQTHDPKLARLRNATVWAVAGSSIRAFLLAFPLVGCVYLEHLGWSHRLLRTLTFISVPLMTFSFVAILYFFVTFYRQTRR